MIDLDSQNYPGVGVGVGGRAGELHSPGPPPNNLFSPRLLLIGTVHGDPQGYERALKLLCRWQPELVTVEVSRFSLRYRQRHEPRWQGLLRKALQELPPGAADHLAIRRLAAQIALPFEVEAARDYARQFGIPWRPLDLGALSRRHLPRYASELLVPENLRTLLGTEDELLEDYMAGEYRRARLSCRQVRRRRLGPDTETVHRERLQVRRLRRLLANHGRVAHLGGWEHLVTWQDERGMWEELADFKPLRLLLDEADQEN